MPEKGLKPFLTGFRETVLDLTDGEGVLVYSGCAGTCTPFAELLAFTLRETDLEQYYSIDLRREYLRMELRGHGYTVTDEREGLESADVVVLLGGLAMPVSDATPDDAREFLEELGNPPLVGVCFMNMFERAGWTDELDFHTIIDGYLEVTVK
ncbi:DUF2124 family protein [Methanopyrus sp.]